MTLSSHLKVSVCHSLSVVDSSAWDRLGNKSYPFTRHAFLYGLEQFGCLEPFGWHSAHFLIHDNNELVAALPCYIKTNSYGELVFDHAWAQAYQRSGVDYYPKLVTAIPYTPATGERFLIDYEKVPDAQDQSSIRETLCDAAIQFCEEQQFSSWHILFSHRETLQQLKHKAIMQRCDIQFHWHNHQYQDFDEFLATLSSRKRKNIKKERLATNQHGFDISMQTGDLLSDAEWQKVYALYASIYDRKNGTPTLTAEFFQHLGKALPQQVLVGAARNEGKIVAASLFFRSNSHLYGRVWGCEQFANNLHFECCYYQGIDYCIEQGLTHFDPGAQGEHKLSRGFLPTKTWSGHWIAQDDFRDAIAGFLQQEQRHIDAYQTQLMQHSPYRNDHLA
ncbi:MAG: putative N-acyltransferase [Gammaproteobacteria bacterium]